MKEKPILKLYQYKDSQFVQIAQIDDYEQISFEHNLYNAGTFTITINYNIPNARLFERGLFVQFGNNKFDFGEIYSLKNSIGADGKGSEYLNVIGYDARYIFKRRVIKNLNSNDVWAMTAKGEVCMRELISSQCGVNAEEKRRLPISNEYNKFLANKFVSVRNNLSAGGYGILGGCQKEKGLSIFIAKLEGIFVSYNDYYFHQLDNMRAENIIWSNRIRKYVCVGASTNYERLIKYSNNGQLWQTAYSEQVDDRILCICETPDKLVAISISGRLFTSDDAVSWTEIQSNLPGHISSICYSEDLRMFVGVSDYHGFIVYSNNLTTWNQVVISYKRLNCIIWNPDLRKFVACGQSGYVITSSDGIHWEETFVNVGEAFWLRYDRETRYTWVCGSNGIARSLNLETWERTDGKGEFLGINEEGRIFSIYPEKTYIQIEENSVIGNTYSVSEAYTNLYDVLCTIATQSQIGWAVAFENNELSLYFYEGRQKENSVYFATDFESLANGQFEDTSESYANTVYVGGKGEGSERDIYEGELYSGIGFLLCDDGFILIEDDGKIIIDEGSEPSSLDRFEAFDDQSSMTTEEEYKAEAESMLTQYAQNITVSGAGLIQSPFIFRKEYDIGDFITIRFSGKEAVTQILSVTEQWSKGSYSLNFDFGKPQNTLSQQLHLMLKKIAGASNKTTAISSVKWYTTPTDKTQGESDVTFGTLGFTGSGGTFTLYLDSESTGAKHYMIYVKNLSGNLTLKTSVSGMNTVTLTSGSYVTSIYVDDEGNIYRQQ